MVQPRQLSWSICGKKSFSSGFFILIALMGQACTHSPHLLQRSLLITGSSPEVTSIPVTEFITDLMRLQQQKQHWNIFYIAFYIVAGIRPSSGRGQESSISRLSTGGPVCGGWDIRPPAEEQHPSSGTVHFFPANGSFMRQEQVDGKPPRQWRRHADNQISLHNRWTIPSS